MPSLDIRSLKLLNYRCFEALEITFHPKLTVLVASNGAGKTSVLDAIAVAFGTYLGAFDEAKGPALVGSDIRLARVRETSSNEMEHAPRGAEIEACGFVPLSLIDTLADGNPPITWKRALSSPTKAKTSVKDARELTDYGKRMQEAVRTPGAEVVLPLLAYYGTGRLWQQKKQTEGKKPDSEKISRTSRTVGYTDCLDPASKYKSFFAWFRYWNLNAKVNQVKSLESGKPIETTEFDLYIQSVSTAVNACLKPSGWGGISYSFSLEELVARHPEHGELPVEWLSDGIRNMIGMVADIAYRATKLNPQLGANASSQAPGIVLIDEVDMHLHPEWQQVVLQGLAEAFPSLQFIVTTHSPQVLSTVQRECIRILGRDTDGRTVATVPLAHTYGQSSQLVMQRVMQVDPLPPIHEKDALRELTRLVDQGDYATSRAVELMKRLGEKLGDTHEQIIRIRRSISRQIELAELAARIREPKVDKAG